MKAPLTITYEDSDIAGDIPMDERPVIMKIEGFATVLVEQDDAKALRLLVTTFLPLFVAGFLWGLHHLRKFFRTVKDGHPFHPDNPRRIKFIGCLIAAWGPVSGIIMYIQGKIVAGKISVPGIAQEIHLDIGPEYIFLGLVIIVIARILEIGVNLQQEQELTI